METKWKHFGENQAPEEKAAFQVIEKLEPPAGVEPATY
jgi:hypothetical protein